MSLTYSIKKEKLTRMAENSERNINLERLSQRYHEKRRFGDKWRKQTVFTFLRQSEGWYAERIHLSAETRQGNTQCSRVSLFLMEKAIKNEVKKKRKERIKALHRYLNIGAITLCDFKCIQKHPDLCFQTATKRNVRK